MRVRLMAAVLLLGCTATPSRPAGTPVPATSPTPVPAAKILPPAERPVDMSRWPLDPPIRYGGRMYPTLQKAVEAVKPGGTLEIPQGIYDQTLKLSAKKGLTLRGLGDGAFLSVSTKVPAVVRVQGSSGITFEHLFFRRAEVVKEGDPLILVTDSNGVSFFRCFLDGAVMRPPDGDGLLVQGGASILFSSSFLRWAATAMVLEHVDGSSGIDRSVIAENTRGVQVKSPGGRFTFNVHKSRIVNGEKNLSVGNAKATTITESIVLLTKGAGDSTPATLPDGNQPVTTAAAAAKLPDPKGVDWSWEPPYGLLDADVASLH